MSAKLLLTNFDGTMFRLEVLPDCRDTRVLLHTRYWNREDQLVPGELEFFGVAAVGFSVNYLDNPAGSELCGLYELEDEEEKMRLHLISSRTDSAESSRWSASFLSS